MLIHDGDVPYSDECLSAHCGCEDHLNERYIGIRLAQADGWV